MDKQFNKEEFLELINGNRKIIFKICNSYCSNKNDREDLAQEIIYQLWRSANSFNPYYKFSTWMYRIALNVAISFYRVKKKTSNTISVAEHFTDVADDSLESGEIAANLELLNKFIHGLDALNKALMLLYLDEHSYKEIAEILGISETNVATKINRIKQKLKQQFENIKN